MTKGCEARVTGRDVQAESDNRLQVKHGVPTLQRVITSY